MEHGIEVGDIIKGFCFGNFGRDSYFDRTVEAVGSDWIATRNTRGTMEMYQGDLVELAEDIQKSNKDII